MHGGLIAAVFLLRPGAPPPDAPVYSVHILAAPAGERAAGVVQDQTQPVVSAPAPVVPPTKPAIVQPKPTAAKTKPVPKVATPTPKSAAPTTPNAAAPTAGGGPTGGKGADVATVDTPGIEFPYPGYTNNIVSQIVRRFTQAQSLEASVRFTIRRDGSVDPESIQLVTRSGNYSFDLRAVGAVEAAANAKAFGALPPGYREDILPVTFRFSPKLIR